MNENSERRIIGTGVLGGLLASVNGLPHNEGMDEPQAFLGDRWIPASAAAIPVGDAGFVLGATVAEQVRTFGGELFRLGDHLARLEHSLRIVGVDPGMSIEELGRVARELVARNHRLVAPDDDLGLSVVVTPGAYPAYSPPGPARPTVCLHTYPLPFRLWADKYAAGEALVTTEVEQVSTRCWPPGLKCRSRMHYYLADRRAAEVDAGARALLLDGEGLVTEASTANVLVFRSGEGLISPPSGKILQGISLGMLVELAAAMGISTIHRELSPEEVATAEEVLLTSTPVCVLPVTRFNGQPVGRGEPGEVYQRLLSRWGAVVGLDIAAQAVRLAARV